MSLTEVQDLPSQRWLRNLAKFICWLLTLATLIVTVIAGGRYWARASVPPLGWTTTTTHTGIYVPPGTNLVKSFTNVVMERMFLGGAGGVGAPQIEEFWKDYQSVAEQEGSRNFMTVSVEEDRRHGDQYLVLSYATFPGEGPLRVAQRGIGEVPSGAMDGHYNLVSEGENIPRLEDGVLHLTWEYEKEPSSIVVLVLFLPVLATIVVAIYIRPAIEKVLLRLFGVQ